MKVLSNIYLNDFGQERTLRCDVNYVSYIIKEKKYDSIPFIDIFDVVDLPKIDVDNLSRFKYCQIGDVTSDGDINPIELDFENQVEELDDYYKKIQNNDIQKPQSGDILISKIRPYLKEIVYIDKYKTDVYFTKAFIVLRPKINSRIAYALIRSILINDLICISRTGKGYPTLNSRDFINIKINRKTIDNILELNNKNDITNKLLKIDDDMNALKLKIIPTSDIINKFFDEYFEYKNEEFYNQKLIKVFNTDFLSLGKNVDARFSCKFHRPSGHYVNSQLKKNGFTKLKEIVEIPMITGQSISDDFDETGDYYYVSMADISKWEVDINNLKRVSNEYANTKLERKIKGCKEAVSTETKINDILMMRSGEGGIGKVAIVRENIKSIFCDFIIRIRLNEKKVVPLFIYYYFRTKYFQYLIEINKKGLGNNTNIFPNNLEDFPVPNINIDDQKKIIQQINFDIDIQNRIIKELHSKSLALDELLKNFAN